MAGVYLRAREAYRRAEIHRLSTDATLDPAPGQEAQAYLNIATLLDLGADNKSALAARLQSLARRLPAPDYARLSQEAFAERAPAARRLASLGHVPEAKAIAGTLAVLQSSQTKIDVQEISHEVLAKEGQIKKDFDGLAAVEADRSGALLAQAALDVKRACPDDAETVARAQGVLARYRSQFPVAIKERFYLRKLYYLAALRYVKKQDGDWRYAQDFLEEILRRDAANEDADTLLDTMTREGLVRR